MISAIILAAGRGQRMGKDRKVLLPIEGIPLLKRLVSELKKTAIRDIIVVIPPNEVDITAVLKDDVKYAIQKEPNGTLKALEAALPLVATEWILILPADIPYLTHHELEPLLNCQGSQLLAMNKTDPTGYGRVFVKDHFVKIIEEKELLASQKLETLINTGIYLLNSAIVTKTLVKVTPSAVTNEYYLPSILPYYQSYLPIKVQIVGETYQLMGMNTPDEGRIITEMKQKVEGRIS